MGRYELEEMKSRRQMAGFWLAGVDPDMRLTLIDDRPRYAYMDIRTDMI